MRVDARYSVETYRSIDRQATGGVRAVRKRDEHGEVGSGYKQQFLIIRCKDLEAGAVGYREIHAGVLCVVEVGHGGGGRSQRPESTGDRVPFRTTQAGQSQLSHSPVATAG